MFTAKSVQTSDSRRYFETEADNPSHVMRRHSSLRIPLATATWLLLSLLTSAKAETIEQQAAKLARDLPLVSYDCFFGKRVPMAFGKDESVTKAWQELELLIGSNHSVAEWSALADHADPKVRTLALLDLFVSNDPAAFKVIYAHRNDQAETFPSEYDVVGRAIIPGSPYDENPIQTRPETVAGLAGRMLELIGFPAHWQRESGGEQTFEEWSAARLGNPDWLGWYYFLYFRSCEGYFFSAEEDQSRYLPLRRQVEGLPWQVRAWLGLWLADELFIISGEPANTVIATEPEIFAAAKRLGSEALLAFLRDGSRVGLRELKADDPAKGRRFILCHGKELFQKSDAEPLAAMGHFITAADANPEMASPLLRKALHIWNAPHENWRRAEAVAALSDLRGDDETGLVVKWFYDAPNESRGSSDQSVFIHEMARRKPKQWRKTLGAIIAQPGFDSLKILDVVYLGDLVNKLSGTQIIANEFLAESHAIEVRRGLRKYFASRPD